MKLAILGLSLLLAAEAQADSVMIDNASPAAFRWTSCSTNPKSVMGRIPSGTTVRVVQTKTCEMSPVLTVDFYKVDWQGSAVWISSGTTDRPQVRLGGAKVGRSRAGAARVSGVLREQGGLSPRWRGGGAGGGPRHRGRLERGLPR